MYSTFAIINIILASHSFVAAVLLFLRRNNQAASRYLSLINFLTGILFFIAYLTLDRYYSSPVFLVCLGIVLVYYLTPLCYLYTFRLSRTETKNDGYHFIPAFMVTFYVSIRWVSGLRQPTIPIEELFNLRYIPFDLYLLLQAGILMLTLYLLLMLLIIRTYNRGLESRYSSIEKRNLRWLQTHLAVGVCGGFIFFTTNIFQYFFAASFDFLFDRVEYAGQLFSVVFLLSIVYFTFLQPDIEGSPGMPIKAGSHSSEPSYTRQRLGEEKEREYVKHLLSFMETEKPYLDPELTIQDLAAKLGIPSAHLTMVLNIHIKKTFYQFINSYRVAYAGELLNDTRMEQENILNVALEAGFNSKSSFNTYFKKLKNMTPREYRRRAAEQAAENHTREPDE